MQIKKKYDIINQIIAKAMKETASDTLIQGFEAGRLRASIRKRQILRNTPEPAYETVDDPTYARMYALNAK